MSHAAAQHSQHSQHQQHSPHVPQQAPLLAAASAGWCCAWWAVAQGWVAVTAALVGVAVTTAAAVVVLVVRRTTRAAQVVLVGAAALAVLASSAATVHVLAAGRLPGWAADRSVVTVTGRVVSDPRAVRSAWQRPGEVAEPRWAVTLHVSRVTRGTSSSAEDADVVVLGPASWSRTVVGSRVQAVGRLRATEPGDDASALLAASRPPSVVEAPPWPWAAAERVRLGLRAAVGDGPGAGAALLPALVVGDTTRLPASLEDELKAAGLAHLTAVSGANLAIVMGAVLVAALTLGVPRGARAVLAAATVVVFVLVARPEPSVLRAAVMGSVSLVGLWSGRPGRGLAALTAAVVVLLVVDPWLSRSFGFALSVVATGGLLVLAAPIASRLPSSWPRPLALAVAVPVAAQLATAPVVLLLQPGVSVVGVPANLVAAPAVVLATLSGALAAAVATVSVPVAAAVALPGVGAASLIAAVASTAAAVPGGTLPWPQGVRGALGFAVLALTVLALGRWVHRGTEGAATRASQGGTARVLPRATVLLALVALVVPSLVAGWLLSSRLPGLLPGSSWPPRDWVAVQCDVGQGAALVVRSGPGRAVLVDVGPVPDQVDGCLRRLGVAHLDLLVLTHDHGDHVLGLPGALRGRTVTDVLVNPLGQPADNTRQVRAWLESAGLVPREGWAGLAGTAGTGADAVAWRTAWPVPPRVGGLGEGSGAVAAHDEEEGSAVNDASVVVLLQVQGLGVVALGDLEEAGQQGVLAAVPADLPATHVVMVAHHGSATQVPALYERLAAPVALIGVGDNDYGHPAAQTLDLLASAGSLVLRTDVHGDVAVVDQGDGGVAVQARRSSAAVAASPVQHPPRAPGADLVRPRRSRRRGS